jgi:phosphoglycerate dehydrogenase-like enzyme
MVLSPRVASSSRRIEFTWALILASARHILTESNSVRFGGWQQTVGMDLRGKTLAVLGLGRIGSPRRALGRLLQPHSP